MAIAKRQRREQPVKTEEGRSKDESENLRENKQPSWLAQFIQRRMGGGGGKHIKRAAKVDYGRRFSSLGVFWVGPPSCLEDVFSFAC